MTTKKVIILMALVAIAAGVIIFVTSNAKCVPPCL